jgi:hypothetical protein
MDLLPLSFVECSLCDLENASNAMITATEMQVRYHTVAGAIMHIIVSSAAGRCICCSDDHCMPSRGRNVKVNGDTEPASAGRDGGGLRLSVYSMLVGSGSSITSSAPARGNG